MKKIIPFILISLLVIGCSTKLKSRNIEEYYTSTGVSKYFLPDVPDWANFTQSAGCFRSKGIRYFDVDAMMKSYSLSYANAIQVQASYNEEYLAVKKQPNVTVTLKDEEVLFFKASEKINSKIPFFDPPTFKQIHLIWLDEILKGKKQEDKFRAFLQSSTQDTGFPVLISACLTKAEIEEKFPGLSMKVISAEMFSVYDDKGVRSPNMHINLDAFFKPDQRLIFYTQEVKKNVEDIRGNYKAANY